MTDATTREAVAARAQPLFLTIDEVCARYGISRSTFYRMLGDPRSGLRAVVVRIPPPRGRVRVPVEAFESWLQRRQSASA